MSAGVVLDYAKPGPRRHGAIEALCRAAGFFVVGLGLVALMPKLGVGGYPSKHAFAAMDLGEIASALARFHDGHGRFPTTAEGLAALVNADSRGYLRRLPTDPWGHQYVYRCRAPSNGRGFQLLSKGRDGIEGTADDVVRSPQPRR
jgi:general secretion pathway protein G